MRICRFQSLVGFVLVVLAGGPAAGQDVTTPRAFDGAFGGAAPRPGVTHGLDLAVTVASALEENDDPDSQQSIFESSGTYESITGGLNYTWQTPRAQIGGSAGSNGRYYNDERRFLSVNQYAGFGVSAQLGRRVSLTTNQSVGCGPLHFQGLMTSGGVTPLGNVSAVATDYSLDEAHMCAYDTNGSFGYALTQRAQLYAVGSVRLATFDEQSGYQGARTYSVGGRFVHGLTRRARLHVGYVRRAGDYARLRFGYQPVLHDLDIGVEYARGLSLTRRTYVDFNTGSTVVSTPVNFPGQQQRLDYRVIGRAGLNHEIGRTWRARVEYNRSIGFVEGFGGLVNSDGATASLTGFINRRTDLSASAGVSSGTVESTTAESPFRARAASGRIRFALAKTWAVFGEYTFYAHRLPPDALVYAVSPTLNRQAARIGLTWWLPLVRR